MDPKVPTASKIIVNYEEPDNISENETTKKSKSSESKEETPSKVQTLIQYNGDILHRVAYKYLF